MSKKVTNPEKKLIPMDYYSLIERDKKIAKIRTEYPEIFIKDFVDKFYNNHKHLMSKLSHD